MKFENTEVFGLENALIGMRLPMSKDFAEAERKCDFSLTNNESPCVAEYDNGKGIQTFIVDKDTMRIATNLVKADKNGCSQPNAKFLRMIHVQTCLTAPQIFMSELDTYKVGVTRNSSSLQHTGMKRDFTTDDFTFNSETTKHGFELDSLPRINELRRKYVETKCYAYFVAMRELIPMSYNYTSIIDLNYANLRTIYHQRKNHRLPYWHEFCDWVCSLPYSKELIIGE